MFEFLTGAGGVIVITWLISLFWRFNQSKAAEPQYIALHAKVDALMQQANIKFKPLDLASPQVTEALQRGEKVEAIKLYQAETGAGLREAKEIVENRISQFPSASLLELKTDSWMQQTGVKIDLYNDVSPQVLRAIEKGIKINAIKQYRDETGVGLKEAKEFVEGAQKRFNL